MPEFYTILARKKSSKYPNVMIFALKINKIPEFLLYFCPINIRILHNKYPKNISSRFSFFFLGGGERGTSPVSYDCYRHYHTHAHKRSF